MSDIYYSKYLKYKNKYLALKSEISGGTKPPIKIDHPVKITILPKRGDDFTIVTFPKGITVQVRPLNEFQAKKGVFVITDNATKKVIGYHTSGNNFTGIPPKRFKFYFEWEGIKKEFIKVSNNDVSHLKKQINGFKILSTGLIHFRGEKVKPLTFEIVIM